MSKVLEQLSPGERQTAIKTFEILVRALAVARGCETSADEPDLSSQSAKVLL